MAMSQTKAEEIIASSETGGRILEGGAQKLVLTVAFIWSVFQLYVASSIPFFLSEQTGLQLVFNNQETRQVHLAFALCLSMLAFPLLSGSSKTSIPIYDYVLAILGVFVCLYLLFNKTNIADRAGLPTTMDLFVSASGLILIVLAVYRTLGLPLVIVASVFVLYVFFGDSPNLPEVVQWKGASLSKALWHYWMQTEGVFGVALGVAASMIFLFVLFGALLEKAGAGNYFIQLAFSTLGHLRGGPAKAAVVASAASGIYSGSSIANVVTTGTFTIPLMKKTGFSAERAGAVEVASSTNGQLTPPVMGAAAFLIAEFTGISYPELVKHALLPAVVSYIALVYIVHLEALKLDLKGLKKSSGDRPLMSKITGFLFGFIAMGALGFFVYYGLGWAHAFLPQTDAFLRPTLVLGAYVFLAKIAAQRPDLPHELSVSDDQPLPRPKDVALTGLYYILPIIVLIWNILIERLSPSLSAYWATVVMTFIVITHKGLKAYFRGNAVSVEVLKDGVRDFVDGMIAGAKNMIGIGVATGVAGIIIGTVSLTGAHQVIGEFVEFLSGGNLMLMLLLVAVMSLILGMGLPTTANYIVVSSLMAPVIVSVGAQSGLVVPLVAVHLFVFYFGILADDTPPVGLAAFAAAAISQGDPIKTGLQGFTYDMRTALLPFLFLFNTELLLIDVTFSKAIFVFIIATLAMLLFAAATQGYFLAKNRLWESAVLLLIAFTLFRPGYWLDKVAPPFEHITASELSDKLMPLPEDQILYANITGPDFDNPDKMVDLTVKFTFPAGADAVTRMDRAGFGFDDPNQGSILEPFIGNPFFETFQRFDFYGDVPVTLEMVKVPADRVAKEVFYLPALLGILLIIGLQSRRQTKPAF